MTKISGSVVYFIRDTNGRVKIGRTEHLPSRLSSLKAKYGPLEIVATVPGGAVLEAQLHREFASDRIVGEWFSASSRLWERVDGLEAKQAAAGKPVWHVDINWSAIQGVVTEDAAKEFTRSIVIDLIDAMSNDSGKMNAYDDLAKALGVTPSWLRKIVGQQEEVAIQAHQHINLMVFFVEFWASEVRAFEERKAQALHKVLSGLKLVPAKVQPDVSDLLGGGDD